MAATFQAALDRVAGGDLELDTRGTGDWTAGVAME
jgi:hypothetical protein